MNVPSEAARPIACEFGSAAMYWQHFATREKYQDAGGLSGPKRRKLTLPKGLLFQAKTLHALRDIDLDITQGPQHSEALWPPTRTDNPPAVGLPGAAVTARL
jgi:hypothetical protein